MFDWSDLFSLLTLTGWIYRHISLGSEHLCQVWTLLLLLFKSFHWWALPSFSALISHHFLVIHRCVRLVFSPYVLLIPISVLMLMWLTFPEVSTEPLTVSLTIHSFIHSCLEYQAVWIRYASLSWGDTKDVGRIITFLTYMAFFLPRKGWGKRWSYSCNTKISW